MRKVTPAHRALALQLLAHEAATDRSSDGLAEAAERVCLKLYERLARLIGPDGFSSLLERALHLAQAERRALKPVSAEFTVGRSPPNAGIFGGLRETTHGREPAEVIEDLAALVGSFVWLLGVFVGEELALRQLRKAWPWVDLGEPGQGTSGSEGEKR